MTTGVEFLQRNSIRICYHGIAYVAGRTDTRQEINFLTHTTIAEAAMQAVTLKDAKRNLSRLVDQVLADAEPRIVVSDSGQQVVVMPLDEFNSWKETLYLLGNPANAAHLRRSVAEAESGLEAKHELTEE